MMWLAPPGTCKIQIMLNKVPPHPAPYTLPFTVPYTLPYALHTLHPTPSTQHPTPCTLSPRNPETLHSHLPAPETRIVGYPLM